MDGIIVKDLVYVYKREKEEREVTKFTSLPIINLFAPRKFDELKAVNCVNFKIEMGDIVAFIGPNGAGKSTTIKMLTGLLEPTSGEINISGFDLKKDKNNYLKNIGVVFGQRTQLWWELPVRDSFELLKDIYEVEDQEYEEQLKWYEEIVSINELIDIPVKKLSLGQRMLCEILAAFLHKPKIIFLDEPTIGLDVSVKNKIRKFITQINKSYKTTIVITTHDSGDIEKLADKVILIDKGKIAYNGSFHNFMNQYGNKNIIQIKPNFDLDNIEQYAIGVEKIRTLLKDFGKIVMTKENNWLMLKVERNPGTVSNIISILQENDSFHDILIKRISLEDVLDSIYNNCRGERGNEKDKKD